MLWKGAVPSAFKSSSSASLSSSKEEPPMLATDGNVEDGHADIMEPEVKIEVEESGDTSEVGEVKIEPPDVKGERQFNQQDSGEVLNATKQAKVCQGILR